jgi:hypothetical protein
LDEIAAIADAARLHGIGEVGEIGLGVQTPPIAGSLFERMATTPPKGIA